MRHPLSTLLALAVVACLSLNATAAGTCGFGAYADDADPAGANVRSGPGTQFPIIGVLKPDARSDDGFTPEFRVSRFENGWFRIGNAVIGQYGDGPEETVFQGPGWIAGNLIGFDIQDWRLYEAPSTNSAITYDLEDWWSTGLVRVTAIHDCQGAFVNVTLTNEAGESATGWATNLCGNQATTCA